MKHKQNSRRIRLVTLATMTACAATRNNTFAQTATQAVVPHASLTAAESAIPTLRFAIPAGPLPAALAQYETVTGLKLTVTLPPGAIDTFQSPGVTGSYTPEAALKLLLTGTGLTAHPVQSGQVASFQIGLRQTESVDVTTSIPTAVSMQKFTEPLLDTPQSVVAVPQFILQEQAVSTLRDSLRNVPGISLAAGESGAQGDNLTIRGFTARNDIFLDGIRDFGSYYRDSFNYEQVDVLEGPAGIEFGRGSTGGVINQESKVPQLGSPDPDKPFAILALQAGTNATRRLTADLDHPLPHIANGMALRLNVMGVESGVAGRDYAEIRRYGVAPSISVGLNSKTHATLSYVHLQEDSTPDYGLPWLLNQLAPGVNRHSYFGFASANAQGVNHLNTSDDILTLRAGHDFGHNLDLHMIARAANYPRNVQITEPQICSNASVSVPVGGTVTALPTSSVTGAVCPYTLASNPASILVNRNQIQIKSVESDLWDQAELTARFKTFGLRHALVAGIEGGQEISNPIKYAYTINKLNSVPSTTLVNPNEQAAFTGTAYIASITHTKSDSVGTWFVDTIHLGRLFELSGGVRFDRFDTSFNLYQPTPPAGATVTAGIPPIEQIVQQPTYRAAFVYKPSSHGSVYFDYGTSFNPSAESLSLSVSSSVLPPEENETFEGGAKWSFLKDRLMTEAAVFRTEKDNARETDPTNSNNIVLSGNQLVKGVQFSVAGRLPHGTDLIAGYAYLSSEVLYSKLFPTSIGYPLANVPKQTFNLFVTHRLPFDLKAGLGTNYVASRTASSTVPFVPLTFSGPNTVAGVTTYTVLSTGMKQVPGYWIFNAMVSRSITEHIQLQANVNNLLNRFYIDQPHPSHLIPGEGANALIGLNYKF